MTNFWRNGLIVWVLAVMYATFMAPNFWAAAAGSFVIGIVAGAVDWNLRR